jgi:outer membrane protein assembly factor BamE (lipoprotein component of BamABCDE complex)
MTQMIGTSFRAVFAALALVLLTSCGASTLKDATGYVPDQQLLDQVVIGRDTQDTVARLLGRPGTTGIIDDRGWYYVKSDYERLLWRAPVEVNRQVVAVSFAENGQVTNIERFGIQDGQVIALNRRVTDSNTQGIGFLRQLFSNFGNLNPGGFLEES